MLKINPKYIEMVRAATTYKELIPLMQKAVELEHSTIPPYLTAMFSLAPGTNREIDALIHSIVVEEMLHMTIASNVMNALGGSPAINKRHFVPDYPSKLPMGIGDGFLVGLERYSIDLVEKKFMKIEEPEHPIVFNSALDFAETITFRTIGEFYHSMQEKIMELPGDELPGDPARQVTSKFFPDKCLFPVTTTEEAVNALNIIVLQGEGTTTSPGDDEDELAHYYKFEELFKGRRLIKDDHAPNGYSFTGDPIPFDEKSVYPIYPNTKAADVAEGSEQRRRVDDFNMVYNQLLNGLHETFNGNPKYLDNTIGLMYDVKLQGEKLCAMPFPGDDYKGYNVGPSFEFVDLN